MKIQELLEEQQLDEFLPALGAAAGVVGRGAMAAGSALGRGAMAAGSALGRGATNIGKNVLQGIAQNAAKQVVAQQQKSQQPKVGGVYNHPKLGALKILAISANGITLDSTKQLGFPITIDPSYIQQ